MRLGVLQPPADAEHPAGTALVLPSAAALFSEHIHMYLTCATSYVAAKKQCFAVFCDRNKS
jgi:hypothetical protein